MNNYRNGSLWRLIRHSSVFSRLFSSPFSRKNCQKGHVYPVWFQWCTLLMTSVPALFKSNDCLGARDGIFFRSVLKEHWRPFQMAVWRFSSNLSADWTSNVSLFLICGFACAGSGVGQEDRFAKITIKWTVKGPTLLKIFQFHIQGPDCFICFCLY